MSEPQVLIHRTNILVLDWLTKRLYWLSSKIARTCDQRGRNIYCTSIISISSLQFTCPIPRIETFRPAPQFLTSLTWTFSQWANLNIHDQASHTWKIRTSTQCFKFNDGISESFISIISRVNLARKFNRFLYFKFSELLIYWLFENWKKKK